MYTCTYIYIIIIYICWWPTNFSVRIYVVDQHTVYTSSVTTNIFSGGGCICSHEQSSYALFVTTNIFYRIFLLVVTHSLYSICYYQHILQDFLVGSNRWCIYCMLINNIFSRIFLLVVTKSLYKLCWYKHTLPEKMLVVTGIVYINS